MKRIGLAVAGLATIWTAVYVGSCIANAPTTEQRPPVRRGSPVVVPTRSPAVAVDNAEAQGLHKAPSSSEGKSAVQPEISEFRQWKPCELSATSQISYDAAARPWVKVKFTADFTGPDQQKLTVAGFWDGGNQFRLRFTPTLPGKWIYRTHCPQDAGLNDLSAEFNVSAAAADEPNPLFRHGGFIKAATAETAGGSRYLTYADGTPFYYLSETLWYFPCESLPLDAPASRQTLARISPDFFLQQGITSALDHVLAYRKKQGFTVVRTGQIGRNGLKNEIQVYYHTTGDIGLTYWQSADGYFDACMNRGLVSMLFPLWKGDKETKDWPNRTEWEELLQYMMARYGAYPVIFGIGPEYNSPSKVATGAADMVLELLAYTSRIDPYHRAQTVQPFPWNLQQKADRMEWTNPAIDFLMVEGGHETPYGVPSRYYQGAWNDQPKPFVSTETTWDGLIRHGYPPHDDYVIRFNQYRAWMLGCKGVDYGAQGLWYPVQHYADRMFERNWGETNLPWWEAVKKTSAVQMGVMRRIMERYRWWLLVPLFDAVEPDEAFLPPPQGAGKAPELHYRQAVASEIPGDGIVMVYLPRMNNQRLSVRLRFPGHDGSLYSAEWIRPVDGQSFPRPEPVKADAEGLPLPERPDFNDWLLILNRRK